MKSHDLKLLAVFAVLVCAILFRSAMEESGYQSPDSRYYLEIAQNFVSGKGFLMTDPKANNPAEATQIPVAVWPIGYPFMIGVVSMLTGLSVLWASKWLNLLFLGGCFLLLRQINRDKAWLLALLFGTYTLLEVFTYTWSEVPFLFFMLLFAVALHRWVFTEIYASGWWLIALLVGSAGMFLCRYIGLFSVPVLGLFGLYLIWKNRPKSGSELIAVGFLSGCVVLAYFYRNYLLEGTLSGEVREFQKEETLGHFSWILFRGLVNELFLIRKNYFKGGTDPLFWALALLQFAWLGWLYIKHLHKKAVIKLDSSRSQPAVFLIVGGAYFAMLILLRLTMPFDSFDFRLLSPLYLLAYLAIIQLLFAPENVALHKTLQLHFVLLFLLSLLVNSLKPTYLKALF